MSRETDARMVIDQLLRDADWEITDKSQVSTEEPLADGRADYLLKNTRTQPLAVIEAKRFSIDPYSAKEQAREYAESLSAPFVILSNGQEHYFWDYNDGDARPILGLPSRADLERRANLRAYLGTIPDYVGEVKGLPLSGVAKGGPADKAGIRRGDVIVELAGKKIENIYDYTFAIEAVKIDEEVDIVVLRDGQRIALKITPGARE